MNASPGSRLRLRKGVSFLFASAALTVAMPVQAVTLDFNSTTAPPPPSGIVPLPWVEDGFTVSGSSAGVQLSGRSPYPGILFLESFRGETVTVTVNSTTGSPFDIFSLEIPGGAPSPLPLTTNSAVLLSSAGGSVTVHSGFSTQTIFLTGPAWSNLSWFRIQYRPSSDPIFPSFGGEFDVDNIVVQIVPEPAGAALAGLAIGCLLGRKLKRQTPPARAALDF